jgi:hypothetical protein
MELVICKNADVLVEREYLAFVLISPSFPPYRFSLDVLEKAELRFKIDVAAACSSSGLLAPRRMSRGPISYEAMALHPIIFVRPASILILV